MLWFGMKCDAPVYEDAQEVEYPDPGSECGYCHEALSEPEPGFRMPYVSMDENGPAWLDVHYECFMRSILGGPAHIRGTCSCFGGTGEHETGMTYRQEAIEVCESMFGLNWKEGFREGTAEQPE